MKSRPRGGSSFFCHNSFFRLAEGRMPFYKTPTARALRLSVRTSDFHSEKRGSTPLGRATLSCIYCKKQAMPCFGVSFPHALRNEAWLRTFNCHGCHLTRSGERPRRAWPSAPGSRTAWVEPPARPSLPDERLRVADGATKPSQRATPGGSTAATSGPQQKRYGKADAELPVVKSGWAARRGSGVRQAELPRNALAPILHSRL